MKMGVYAVEHCNLELSKGVVFGIKYRSSKKEIEEWM
jgi:hypothetical protein